jgi:hypothetical protein
MPDVVVVSCRFHVAFDLRFFRSQHGCLLAFDRLAVRESEKSFVAEWKEVFWDALLRG